SSEPISIPSSPVPHGPASNSGSSPPLSKATVSVISETSFSVTRRFFARFSSEELATSGSLFPRPPSLLGTLQQQYVSSIPPRRPQRVFRKFLVVIRIQNIIGVPYDRDRARFTPLQVVCSTSSRPFSAAHTRKGCQSTLRPETLNHSFLPEKHRIFTCVAYTPKRPSETRVSISLISE